MRTKNLALEQLLRRAEASPGYHGMDWKQFGMRIRSIPFNRVSGHLAFQGQILSMTKAEAIALFR